MRDVVLFLDLDGVLNDHTFNQESQSCTILPECAQRLNAIIQQTNCRLVISSAWRYMVPDSMTLSGFEYLLQTHGVNAHKRIDGVTCRDEVTWERHLQIIKWLEERNHHQCLETRVDWWCVLDDDPMGMKLGKDAWRLVRTDGLKGLQDDEVQRVVDILNGRQREP